MISIPSLVSTKKETAPAPLKIGDYDAGQTILRQRNPDGSLSQSYHTVGMLTSNEIRALNDQGYVVGRTAKQGEVLFNSSSEQSRSVADSHGHHQIVFGFHATRQVLSGDKIWRPLVPVSENLTTT